MEIIKKVESSWDKEKKAVLVTLGQGPKPYGEILTYVENEIELSKRMTTFDHKINCFRNDGIYQLHRAIENKIGATNVADREQGPSGGSTAVETIEVILADGTRKKVPYGKINLPDMGPDAHIEIRYSDKGKYMRITGECQFKFQTLIDTIIVETNHLLNTDSIYKSQAIEINATIDNGQPQILNLSGLDSESMILSKEVEIAMIPLKARILNPEKCIANKIPIKFGALLEGPYGLVLQ